MAGGGAAISTALAVAGAIPWWAAVPWLVALAALPLYVLVGLRAAGAPASAYRALLRAPLFVLGKLRHVRRFFGVRGDTWVPTERADDTFEE
jgi:hypothetical protein